MQWIYNKKHCFWYVYIINQPFLFKISFLLNIYDFLVIFFEVTFDKESFRTPNTNIFTNSSKKYIYIYIYFLYTYIFLYNNNYYNIYNRLYNFRVQMWLCRRHFNMFFLQSWWPVMYLNCVGKCQVVILVSRHIYGHQYTLFLLICTKIT